MGFEEVASDNFRFRVAPIIIERNRAGNDLLDFIVGISTGVVERWAQGNDRVVVHAFQEAPPDRWLVGEQVEGFIYLEHQSGQELEK